ncbi:MAG TPA: glycoside hydrolase [Verrucomicrobiae bacterium]
MTGTSVRYLLILAWLVVGTDFRCLRAAPLAAQVDLGAVRVPHFEGWGVSLCWWAHIMGNFTNREEIADLAFKDLGLNIVRYNIGGGENPRRDNTMEWRARIPGYAPATNKWDWAADASQRWMLQAAVKRGANKVVAFANSPPYWMTVSGSVTGSANGRDDNLLPEQEGAFAHYLALVTSNLVAVDKIPVGWVTPMNEPGSDWWQLGHRQEGTHMSVAQQQRVVKWLRQELDQAGLPQIGVVATEDNDEARARASLAAYSTNTLSLISPLVTHTYTANDAPALQALAERTGKPLWVSEYGDGERTGLLLARRIRDDLTDLRAAAWIYWQFADGGNWGLIRNRLDGEHQSFQRTRKYPVMAQFSRFIRPGCRLVATDQPDTLAACDSNRHELILVVVNDHSHALELTYSLKGANAATDGLGYRTSADEEVSPLPAFPIVHNQFTMKFPAGSVTTLVIPEPTLTF